MARNRGRGNIKTSRKKKNVTEIKLNLVEIQLRKYIMELTVRNQRR